MGLGIAFKAFFKALKNKKEAEKFVNTEENLQIKEETTDHSHLRLLQLLQHSGRLVDFLQEDISGFNDAQVGAVVRKIHEGCRGSLEDFVTVRPLFDEQEGANVTIPENYDPAEVKVVGNVKGDAPYKGILRHRGWKAHKLSLPKQVGEIQQAVLAPAEVEL